MAAHRFDGERARQRSLPAEPACPKAAARSLADSDFHKAAVRLSKWVGLVALTWLLAAPVSPADPSLEARVEALERRVEELSAAMLADSYRTDVRVLDLDLRVCQWAASMGGVKDPNTNRALDCADKVREHERARQAFNDALAELP